MAIEERVDTLENAMKNLAYQAMKTERSFELFQQEMRKFQDEMREFREESERNRATADAERKHNMEELGRISNKFGTFAEDFVLPNFPRILEKYFGVEELERMLPRAVIAHPGVRGKQKEFDLLAWTVDTVFWNETRSRATQHTFQEFIDDERLFDYLPELHGKTLIRIASALYINSEVLDFLTRNGVYALMLDGENMEIVNYREITKRDPPKVSANA